MPKPDRFPVAYWIATALARAASAAKEVLLATALGTSPWKDAWVVAWTAPTLMASYCNETLPALLTPLWVGPGGGRGRGRGVVIGAVAVLAVLSLAGLLGPRALIACLAPAWSGPARVAAVELERWMAINIVLLGGQALLAARLNARRRFAWTPAGAGLPAVAVIATLALTRGWELARRMVWLAAALGAGSALGLAVMAFGLVSNRKVPVARCPLGPTQHHERSPWQPLAALLLAMAVLNLVPVAERMAAAGLHPGSVAAYDYGERLVRFVFGLSVAPFTAVCFTRLSESAAPGGGGTAVFAQRFEQGLRGLLTVAIPLSVGLAMFAPLITRCVYGWGRFQQASLAATAPVVAILGAALGLDAVVYFLLFALYAGGRAGAKLPLALAVAGANVPLAFLGAERWGLTGLAVAHGAAYTGALGWMAWRRERYLPAIGWRRVGWAGAKAGIVTLAAAAATHGLLPAAALAGRLGGGASWGWMLAAVTLTAGGAAGLAHGFAPELGLGLRQALAPPALPSSALGLAPMEGTA